jgi:TRAP-type C4-dicarboxylate transport system permease small subunit
MPRTWWSSLPNPATISLLESETVKKTNTFLDNIEFWTTNVTAFLLAVVFISVSLQVFSRFILRLPLAWTQETAQYAFIWMVYLAAAVGLRQGMHLKIGLILDRLPAEWRRTFELLSELAALAFAITLIVAGSIVAWRTRLHRSPAIECPMGLLYLVFPLSGLVMTIYILERILKRDGSMTSETSPKKPRPPCSHS